MLSDIIEFGMMIKLLKRDLNLVLRHEISSTKPDGPPSISMKSPGSISPSEITYVPAK